MKVNELIISVRATRMQYMYMCISTHASEVSTLIALKLQHFFFLPFFIAIYQ